MAPEIERITNTFLSGPARIEVARQATTSETIEQGLVKFKASRRDREASEKRKLLRMMIDSEGAECRNAIIFCNRKTDVDICAKSLKKYGYDAAAIHGDLDQSHRMRTLDGFRDGSLRFLVASDVAARGLDIPNVSHVFNFDVPSHAEDYVHRIGRTGRAGRKGKAITLCSSRDEKYLDAIEKLVQNEIPRLESPMGTVPEQSDDDAPRESKSSRSRSRSTSSRSSSSRSKSDAPARTSETATASADVTPASRETAPAEKPRSNEPRKSSGSSRRRDSGPQVVGMGDHMPSFIALSFDERRAS